MNQKILNEALEHFKARNYMKAKNLFLSIANENVTAQYYLGVMFRIGLGTEDDQKEAFSWFLKAAKQGHKESQFLVGCAYIVFLTFMRRETELVKVDYDRFEENSKNDLSIWQDDLPYYEFEGVWRVALFDKVKNQGFWLVEGEVLEGIEVESFNPDTEVIKLKGGLSLSLKDSDKSVLPVPSGQVKSSKSPILGKPASQVKKTNIPPPRRR